MKLSELVELRNQLEQLDVDQAKLNAQIDLNKIMFVAQASTNADLLTKLQTNYQQVQTDFDQFKVTAQQILSDLNKQINEQASYWFQESYRLYDQEMSKFETTDYILNRRLTMPIDAMELIRGRLRMHANWKYPGMIIRPGLENFVEELVCYDPLYLVDQSHDLLLPCLQKFNPLYQNRLRSYSIKESLNLPILEKIPNNQFGVVFAYNFFNFKPLDLMRRYLTEIYQKLRPGGILIMTFNDGDQRRAVEEVENHFACYTPGRLVKEMSHSIGYTEVFRWSHPNEASMCIELKKAGDLASLRGGQTLAIVQDKIIDTNKKTL